MLTAEARKRRPVASGVLAYFPNALREVAHCSWVGNEQHNPGEELRWAKEKSSDELDALARHLLNHLSGEVWDTSGVEPVRHLTKIIWRACAALERALEKEKLAELAEKRVVIQELIDANEAILASKRELWPAPGEVLVGAKPQDGRDHYAAGAGSFQEVLVEGKMARAKACYGEPRFGASPSPDAAGWP
jgi:hypothetical protein